MRPIYLIFGILLLFGCAQQVAPTGGPKDETPPKILEEVPANLSTQFVGKQIEIRFDEFIQLKSTSEQVIISPPVLKTPTFQLKRKSLFVKFEEELTVNTTYTINFGEAIRDNNEGNILTNYTYVFSTGAHLDSMQLKGKLKDALTGEPETEALVMLYKTDQDSLPLDTIPDYFTRTDEGGNYHIQNIANQPYKIFALKDENANYKFDVPTEKIGFLDSLVLPFAPPVASIPDTTVVDSLATEEPTDSVTLASIKGDGSANMIQSYDMRMFVEEDTTQFLKKAYCNQFGKLVFIYNRPVNRFDFSVANFSAKKQWKLTDLNPGRDSITVWITEAVPDTMNCLVQADDLATDTVELVMKSLDESENKSATSLKGKGKKKEEFGLKIKFKPTNGKPPKPGKPLQLVSNHPILGFDITRLKLYEDSVRVIYDITSNDPALRTFDISYDWKQGKTYRLLVLDSAFTDLYDLWNDTLETTFVASGKDGYGTISVNVKTTPETKVLVEVISTSNVLIERKATAQSGVVQFEKLEPGTYSVDVVLDLNDNGKWDSGLYLEKLQPEPISRIKSGVEVRANWDFEIEWSPESTLP